MILFSSTPEKWWTSFRWNKAGMWWCHPLTNQTKQEVFSWGCLPKSLRKQCKNSHYCQGISCKSRAGGCKGKRESLRQSRARPGAFRPSKWKASQATIRVYSFWINLGFCPPTPPLSQHFAPSETQMLALSWGTGRWAAYCESRLSIKVAMYWKRTDQLFVSHMQLQ